MSDEPVAVEESTKKKKGKLPVIIVLALLLGAGGFFGMKARSHGGKQIKPELKLGKTEKLDEFLTNLGGPSTYIRTTIAIQFFDGCEPKTLEEYTPSLRDAVIMRLSMKSLADVNTVEGKLRLKAELAEDINKVLTADGKLKRARTPDAGAATHADWDSQTGPVAKILFSTFATQ